MSAVAGYLPFHDREVLIAGVLRGIQQPDVTVRRFEQDGILLASTAVEGDFLRIRPGFRIGGLAGEIDADIGLAFLRPSEPCAEEIAVP